MAGYSSLGSLSAPRDNIHTNIEVECFRGDDVIDPAISIDFVKLDLQGGKLNALKGCLASSMKPSFYGWNFSIPAMAY